MRDAYLSVDEDNSYYCCHRNPKRAELLQRQLRNQAEGKPKKKLDVMAVAELLLSLTIFAMPFWMLLAGALLERLGL